MIPFQSAPWLSSQEKQHVRWQIKFELANNKKAGEEMAVKELVDKKSGHPLLLGSELDKQEQAYLTTLRANGAV